MNPLVSVVVTTYNQAPYIGEALKSVFSQTYKPLEVIVVDDGSTDDTPSRIAPFNDRISYIRQKNQGVAGSRNAGIRKASGEFIAFLDGDDLWDPYKLSVQVDIARHHPNSGLIVVDGIEFDDSGMIRKSLFLGPFCKDLSEDAIISGNYYHQFLQGQIICTTSQVMVPAKVFKTVEMSDSRFIRGSDYDLYIRIAAKFDVTFVKKSLTLWRCHSNNVSGPRNLRCFSYLPEGILILRKHLREACPSDRVLIHRIIKSNIASGAERLYNYGLEIDKVIATRSLCRLLVSNLTYPIAAVFLAGLWFPGVVRKRLGPTVRSILCQNRNE